MRNCPGQFGVLGQVKPELSRAEIGSGEDVLYTANKCADPNE